MKDAVYAGVASESGPSSPGHHWAEQGPGAPHAEAGDSVLPKGLVSDRTRLEQDIHAMAMNLVVAAITLWNTAYLNQALKGAGGVGSRRLPAAHLPARVGAHNDHR